MYSLKTILPVVLYSCEALSLTLRKECWLEVFENRILRRIFGSKRDENGECRRLQNEELHGFMIIKSRRLRWVLNIAKMEKDSIWNAFQILTGKRHFGRPRR